MSFTDRYSYLSLRECSSPLSVSTDTRQYRIFIITKGSGYFQHQGIIRDFSSGDCLLIHSLSDLIFSPDFNSSYEFRQLSFSLEDVLSGSFHPAALGIMDDYLRTPQTIIYFPLKKPDYDLSLSYTHIIHTLQKDPLSHSLFLLQHTLSSLLFLLARAYHFSDAKKRQGHQEAASREVMLTNVTHYIQQNFSDVLSLSVIADYVFTNPSYLSRIFKEKYGLPLSSYINQVRINAAKKMLLDTEDLIIDIAISCGYNNIPHFNRVFREQTGMSPSQFRKANKASSFYR